MNARQLFIQFMALTFEEKRSFVKLIIDDNSRLERSTRIRQHDTDDKEETGAEKYFHGSGYCP